MCDDDTLQPSLAGASRRAFAALSVNAVGGSGGDPDYGICREFVDSMVQVRLFSHSAAVAA